MKEHKDGRAQIVTLVLTERVPQRCSFDGRIENVPVRPAGQARHEKERVR